MGPQPLLDRPVREEGGLDGAAVADGAPASGLAAGSSGRVLDDGVRALGTPVEHAVPGGRGLHDDLPQPGQGEQQGVVDAGQQALHQVFGGGVAQREDDHGVVALGGGPLGGQRQAQQRDVPVAAAQFVAEAGAAVGCFTGQLAGLGQGPADTAVAAHDGGLVGHREDRREADAEAADGFGGARGPCGLPLRGGPQGAQRLHARRVQRGTGVGDGQHAGPTAPAGVQGEPQPAGHPGPGRGVGGVLRQLDDEPVAVAAEGQVLLCVGVLAEPGWARAPGIEHPAPQPGRAEGVHATLGRRHSHAHAAASKLYCIHRMPRP